MKTFSLKIFAIFLSLFGLFESAFAGMGADAATALAAAQTEGITAGTAVVGLVAALVVVGVVIGLIKRA